MLGNGNRSARRLRPIDRGTAELPDGPRPRRPYDRLILVSRSTVARAEAIVELNTGISLGNAQP